MFENKRGKNNIDRYLRHILEIEEGKYWYVVVYDAGIGTNNTSRKTILAQKERENVIFCWECAI